MYLTRYGRMEVDILKFDEHGDIEDQATRLPAK